MHSVTDRQTDRRSETRTTGLRQYSRSYCVSVRSAEKAAERCGIILLKTFYRRVIEYSLRYSPSTQVANYSDSTALPTRLVSMRHGLLLQPAGQASTSLACYVASGPESGRHGHVGLYMRGISLQTYRVQKGHNYNSCRGLYACRVHLHLISYIRRNHFHYMHAMRQTALRQSLCNHTIHMT